MKKALLLMSAVLCTVNVSAQCVPDTTVNPAQIFKFPAGSKQDPNTGLFFMPDAFVNQNYQEVLHFAVPPDTNIMGVQAGIDSMRILGISGLPASFSLQCSNASCTFDGGEFGCFVISGTPSQPDTTRIKIAVELFFSLPIGPPLSQKDTLDPRLALAVLANTGTEELTEMRNGVYPNPAQEVIHLAGADFNGAQISIINTTGKLMLHSEITEIPARLPIHHLRAGLYLYQIKKDGVMLHRGKLRIAD